VWQECLGEFGAQAQFVRSGLTPQQVRRFDLDQFAIAVKPSDSRARQYVTVHGALCWELDAIDKAHLIAAIDADIESWLDRSAWQGVERAVKRQRALL